MLCRPLTCTGSVFALFASLASALSLSLVSGPNIGIGTSISLNVVLGATLPGNYTFVLYSGSTVIGSLDTVDLLVNDSVVSLLLPNDIEPG